MGNLELCKAELESVVLNLAGQYLPQLELILSVPGINDPFMAISVIAEIGVDMSVFPVRRNIKGFAGLF